jgi:hypothetical protein
VVRRRRSGKIFSHGGGGGGGGQQNQASVRPEVPFVHKEKELDAAITPRGSPQASFAGKGPLRHYKRRGSRTKRDE